MGAVLLACVLSYFNALSNGFVYDDTVQILQNPRIRDYREIPKALTTNFWDFGGGKSNYYRPMQTLLYMACYYAFGLDPLAYHLFNLALHGAVSILVFLLGLRLVGDWRFALLGGLLFAVHPIHTESVTWVAGITDVSSTLFVLLSFLLYARAQAEPGFGLVARVGSLGAFALALLSKEVALVLPLLLVLYQHFGPPRHREQSLRARVLQYVPHWVVLALYAALRIRLLGHFVVQHQELPLHWTQWAGAEAVLLARYLWKSLVPVDLKAFHVFYPPAALWDWQVLVSAAACFGFAFLVFFFWSRGHFLPAFALAWMGISLAPVLNITAIGRNVFAERYLYLPTVGLSLFAGWSALRLWKRGAELRTPAAVAFGIVLVLFTLQTAARNRDWRDNFSLYSKTVQQSPDAVLMRMFLGNEYFLRGDRRSARAQYEAAVALERAQNLQWNPVLAHEVSFVYNNLGFLNFEQGRVEEAERFFRLALEREPKNLDAINNLAAVLSRSKRYEEALRLFHQALAMVESDHHTETLHYNLALIYRDLGRLEEALREFQETLRIAPHSPEAYLEASKILAALQREREAMDYVARGLSFAPRDAALLQQKSELELRLSAR